MRTAARRKESPTACFFECPSSALMELRSLDISTSGGAVYAARPPSTISRFSRVYLILARFVSRLTRSPLPFTIAVVLTPVALFVSDAGADARAGEKKAQLCLLCHRIDASVGAPTLEQQPSRYLAAQTAAFKSGKRAGPEMRSNVARLSAKDIRDIADYFSSQRAKPARFAEEPDPGTIALGAASAKQLNCANCHAADYRGAKDIPRLAGQVPSYLERQIAEFKRSARAHPAIPASADRLGNATIQARISASSSPEFPIEAAVQSAPDRPALPRFPLIHGLAATLFNRR